MTEINDTRQARPSSEGQSPPPPPPSGESAEPWQPEMSQDARNMAMLCHLLGIVGFVAPLMIWLIERDKHRFVDEHGREAMNYQISMLIYGAAASLSCFAVIGLFLAPALAIVHTVLVIIGATRAQQGGPWHYPIAISFLK